MATVPFQISDSRGHKVTGLLYLEEEYLVFEIQARKWGLFKSPPEKVKAEFGVIDHITLERGLFGDSIFIVPRRSDLLNAIPGDHKGELKLKVAKRYRELSQSIVSDVTLRKRRW